MPDPALLQQWFAANSVYLGVIIGVIAFVESFAILGIVVPGVTLLAGAAFVAGTGVYSLWGCLGCAFAGAVIGDGSSFLIGHRFKQGTRKVWPFSAHPDWLERGERFFASYGVASIVIGRFIGPIRPIIPLVAGMLGLRTAIFFLVNVGSALAWAPVYILPGFLLGAAVETRFASPALLTTAALVIAGVIALFAWLHHHYRS